MSLQRGSRPALKLVEGTGGLAVEWGWFCGHCAAPAPGGMAPAPTARVCGSCGFGLLLETRQDVLPGPRDAFLVIDSSLLVQAMSVRAEKLLAFREEDMVNHPVAELLVPADAEAQGPEGFAASIVSATLEADEPRRSFVRPWNTFGVRMQARIAPCGPPRAALVVLEDVKPRRLRAVD